jgi:hypothetical protein
MWKNYEDTWESKTKDWSEEDKKGLWVSPDKRKKLIAESKKKGAEVFKRLYDLEKHLEELKAMVPEKGNNNEKAMQQGNGNQKFIDLAKAVKKCREKWCRQELKRRKMDPTGKPISMSKVCQDFLVKSKIRGKLGYNPKKLESRIATERQNDGRQIEKDLKVE